MAINVIRNIVTITLSFAITMLVIVGGSRIVEMLNYMSALEQILAIVMVGIVGCKTVKFVPNLIANWLEKDD